jgi:hypothetical protein
MEGVCSKSEYRNPTITSIKLSETFQKDDDALSTIADREEAGGSSRTSNWSDRIRRNGDGDDKGYAGTRPSRQSSS